MLTHHPSLLISTIQFLSSKDNILYFVVLLVNLQTTHDHHVVWIKKPQKPPYIGNTVYDATQRSFTPWECLQYKNPTPLNFYRSFQLVVWMPPLHFSIRSSELAETTSPNSFKRTHYFSIVHVGLDGRSRWFQAGWHHYQFKNRMLNFVKACSIGVATIH